MLELLHDKTVVYYNTLLQQTKPHGQWHQFRNSHGTVLLSITFTWTGNDKATWLRTHLLQQIMPGLYRTTDHKQVYYVPEEFDKRAPIHREELEPFALDVQKNSDVKHFFLWLHPYKKMDFLSLLQNGSVQFAKGTSLDLSDGGPQNGTYEYAARMEDTKDCWFINFHAAGKEPAPTTLLSRASEDGNIWRASGDHTGILPDDERPKLKAWHIIAVRTSG